jgi:hypothetical protein
MQKPPDFFPKQYCYKQRDPPYVSFPVTLNPVPIIWLRRLMNLDHTTILPTAEALIPGAEQVIITFAGQ